MVKAQLVSVVAKLLVINGETLKDSDRADAESLSVPTLEGILVHQVEKLEERLAQQDIAHLTEDYQDALRQLADANVKLELLQAVENENVMAVVKLINAKEERISELEKMVKLQSTRITELDEEIRIIVSKYEQALKRLGEKLLVNGGGETLVPENNNNHRQQQERTSRPEVEQNNEDNIAVLARRLSVTATDPLWKELVVRRDINRFTLFFPGDFYEQHKWVCKGFLGGIRQRAVFKKLKTWFEKGYLIVVTQGDPTPQTTEI